MTKTLSRMTLAHIGNGYLFGLVVGLSVRRNPQDYDIPIIGLKGMFETIPENGIEPVRSQLLFLPDAATKHIAKSLLGDKPMPLVPTRGKPTDEETSWEHMELILEIKKQDDGRYGIRIVDDCKKADPLFDLRKRAMAAATPRVEPVAAKRKGTKHG